MHVIVHTISGASYEFHVDVGCNISQLKKLIVESSGIPELAQSLLIGSVAQNDDDVVSEQTDGSVSMTLLVSVEQLYETLRLSYEDEDGYDDLHHSYYKQVKAKKLGALEALGEIVQKEDARAITELIDCLKDWDETVRRDVSKTLGIIAEKGNERVTAALYAALVAGDWDPNVTSARLQALSHVTERGNERALNAVVRILDRREVMLRCQGVLALQNMADVGNEIAVGAVIAILEDPEAVVKIAALQVLPQLVEKGNSDASAAIVKQLESSDARDVKDAAAFALGQIVEPGDESALCTYLAN